MLHDRFRGMILKLNSANASMKKIDLPDDSDLTFTFKIHMRRKLMEKQVDWFVAEDSMTDIDDKSVIPIHGFDDPFQMQFFALQSNK